jgi:hypothetical protein
MNLVKHVAERLIQLSGPVTSVVSPHGIAMFQLKCQRVVRQALLQVGSQLWSLHTGDKSDLSIIKYPPLELYYQSYPILHDP